MTANELTNIILMELPNHFPCRVWRRNVGGGYPAELVGRVVSLLLQGHIQEAIKILRRTRVVHFGLPGESDIDGIVKIRGVGVRLAIEVKTGREKLRDDQVSFGRMVREHGGIFIVARSVDEAIEGVRDAVESK